METSRGWTAECRGHEQDVVEGESDLGTDHAHVHPRSAAAPACVICTTAHRRLERAFGGPGFHRSIYKGSGRLR